MRPLTRPDEATTTTQSDAPSQIARLLVVCLLVSWTHQFRRSQRCPGGPSDRIPKPTQTPPAKSNDCREGPPRILTCNYADMLNARARGCPYKAYGRLAPRLGFARNEVESSRALQAYGCPRRRSQEASSEGDRPRRLALPVRQDGIGTKSPEVGLEAARATLSVHCKPVGPNRPVSRPARFPDNTFT